jgi:hypothetical protein
MNTATFDHNRNLVERTVDNGDGTGTHTDYRTDPPTVTNLTGLPIPEEPTPTVEDRIAELEAIIAALLDAP